MSEQPMLGLHLEPTIAMRRGQAWIEQCMSCGTLVAVSGSTNPDQRVPLEACPVCGLSNWKRQDVGVGPVSAKWAHHLVGAVVALVEREPGHHPQLEAAIEQAKSSTREYAVWTGSRHDRDAA